MAKITHFAKIKEGKGQTYYLDRYNLTATGFTGVDEETASYLRSKEQFEVITENQHNKLTGKAPAEPPKEPKEPKTPKEPETPPKEPKE